MSLTSQTLSRWRCGYSKRAGLSCLIRHVVAVFAQVHRDDFVAPSVETKCLKSKHFNITSALTAIRYKSLFGAQTLHFLGRNPKLGRRSRCEIHDCFVSRHKSQGERNSLQPASARKTLVELLRSGERFPTSRCEGRSARRCRPSGTATSLSAGFRHIPRTTMLLFNGMVRQDFCQRRPADQSVNQGVRHRQDAVFAAALLQDADARRADAKR
jgi:hypothetical protein